MEIAQSVDVACSPEHLYKLVATQADQLRWVGGLKSATSDSREASALLQVGDPFRQRLERGPVQLDLEGTVTAAEAGARFAFEASARDVRFSVDVRLEATAGGTRLTQRSTVELENFALKLMASKIRAELETKGTEDLARLKALGEG